MAASAQYATMQFVPDHLSMQNLCKHLLHCCTWLLALPDVSTIISMHCRLCPATYGSLINGKCACSCTSWRKQSRKGFHAIWSQMLDVPKLRLAPTLFLLLGLGASPGLISLQVTWVCCEPCTWVYCGPYTWVCCASCALLPLVSYAPVTIGDGSLPFCSQ